MLLNSISISNARRFGENVQIEFGEGATIILAPNGTGKTTLFEALELAVTGSIKRLEKCPEAIIRDGVEKMSVHLDFDENKYCEVEYYREGMQKKYGDYIKLFGEAENSSLPYLYRLTHYLEQRGKEWLIEKDDKSVGSLLRQLPIGSELQLILSKKQSALKIIAQQEADSEYKYKCSEKNLSNFLDLINKKENYSLNNKLISINEIWTSIQEIDGKVGDGRNINEIEFDYVNSCYERTKLTIDRKYEEIGSYLVKLIKLQDRVVFYNENVKILFEKQEQTTSISKELLDIEARINITKQEVCEKNNSINIIKNNIVSLNIKLTILTNMFHKKENLEQKKKEFLEIDNIMDDLKEDYNNFVKKVAESEQLKDRYEINIKEIESQKNKLNRNNEELYSVRKWEQLIETNRIIHEEVSKLCEENKIYEEKKTSIEDRLEGVEKTYNTKKSELSLMNEASDAIQNAIEIIAKNVNQNQKKCPVCQAEYTGNELFERIEKSLNSINPIIPNLIEEERKALEILDEIKNEKKIITYKLDSISIELNNKNNYIENNDKSIRMYKSNFENCKTFMDARTYLEEENTLITQRIEQLSKIMGQVKLEKIIEEINLNLLHKKEIERRMVDLNSKNHELHNEIGLIEKEIEILKNSKVEESKDEIIQGIYVQQDLEMKEKNKLDNLELKLFEIESTRNEKNNLIIQIRETLSLIKSNQEGVNTEWNQLGLDGIPNSERLQALYKEVELIKKDLILKKEQLNVIEQNLVNWKIANQYHEIEKCIKEIRGDHSEEEYIEILKKDTQEKHLDLINIGEKKQAVTEFLQNAVYQSEHIDEQINTINEPWKRLLNRIVINPLISSAPLLKNSTSRNLPIAKTYASIHNKNVDIVDIASEAQLSDLQLTLLLSMANKYQWTKWKALLLDDPAQHHDLVHASSVFDVLRDYIVDFNYQIMMSTHDSSQAHFFNRKLENEGISSKIYQLIPQENGVRAERID